MDVITICGNGASYDVLSEAGAGAADLLIAVTGADEVNLLCCLTAKKLGARYTIARVRNPDYDRHVVFLHDELACPCPLTRSRLRQMRYPEYCVYLLPPRLNPLPTEVGAGGAACSSRQQAGRIGAVQTSFGLPGKGACLRC